MFELTIEELDIIMGWASDSSTYDENCGILTEKKEFELLNRISEAVEHLREVESLDFEDDCLSCKL